MGQVFKVREDQNIKFAVRLNRGLVFCMHDITLRQKGKNIWNVDGDSMDDDNKFRDFNSEPQTDIYPIGDILMGRKNIVMINWRIDIESFTSSGEIYDATISVIIDDDSKELVHLSSEKNGVLEHHITELGFDAFRVVS